MDLPCTADGPRDAHAPGAGARQPAEERREAHHTDGRRTPRTPTTSSAETQRPGAPSPQTPVTSKRSPGQRPIDVGEGARGPVRTDGRHTHDDLRAFFDTPGAGVAAEVGPGEARGAAEATGSPRRRPACRRADAGARWDCGGRSRPCSPASRSTTSSASNSAGRPAPRDRSSRHWPAPCVSTRTNAPTWFPLAGLAPPGPDTVPAHLTPSGQRLLDRLIDTPVVGLDAAMTLLVANPCTRL